MTRSNKTRIIGTALIISSLLVLLPGCEEKSSAEKAGEKIDNVIENIGDNIDEAIEKGKE